MNPATPVGGGNQTAAIDSGATAATPAVLDTQIFLCHFTKSHAELHLILIPIFFQTCCAELFYSVFFCPRFSGSSFIETSRAVKTKYSGFIVADLFQKFCGNIAGASVQQCHRTPAVCHFLGRIPGKHLQNCIGMYREQTDSGDGRNIHHIGAGSSNSETLLF